MGKTSRRLLAIFIAIVMTLGMFPFTASAATVAVGGNIQDEINKLAPGGGTVTVTGSQSNQGTTLKLDIPGNVTVIWNAVYRGTANPLIDLAGDGTFEVSSTTAWIQNTSSANSFTTLRANDGIKVEVKGGTVQAGLGSAIEGTGTSTVTVSGTGTVFNEATNNMRPVINMTNAAANGINVIVNGGEVFADLAPRTSPTANHYGYVIQTYGNVVVNGGKVYTNGINGRCINLVGMNSNALVTGGEITATGDAGTAISTSTTAPGQVAKSSVTVSGGFVASYATGNGWAIHTTGAESTVNITGGCVFAFGNNTSLSNPSVTSIPNAATNSVIFIQGRAGGFTPPPVGGVVIAWDRAAWNSALHNRGVYFEGSATPHLLASSPTAGTAVWTYKRPAGYSDDGISYNFGPGSQGFIPLTEVKVVDPFYTIETATFQSGTITPSHPKPNELVVPYGGSASFAIEAAPGYHIGYVQVYNPEPYVTSMLRPTLGTISSYVFTNVTQNYVIFASFAADAMGQHTIVAYAGPGGSISPQGLVSVAANTTDRIHTITANAGYRISGVVVDGNPVTLDAPVYWAGTQNLSSGTYTFLPITRNSVITATFERYDHTIEAITGVGGSISPGPGFVSVPHGGSQSFTITPESGYFINQILLDTVPQTGVRSTFEITNVINNHTIEATFTKSDFHTIIATASNGGSISPSGELLLEEDNSQSFTITPNSGFRISRVLVDGVNVGAVGSYIFTGVIRDHTIHAEFVRSGGGGGGGQPPVVEPEQNNENGENGENGANGGGGQGTAETGNKDVSRLLNTERHIQYIQGVGNNIFAPDRDINRAEVAQIFFNLLLDQDIEITKRFPDEAHDAWYERAVNTLATLGILTGYPDGGVHPDAAITRAEFVAMAVRFAENLPDNHVQTPFGDIAATHWAYDYINAAVQFGWISGYGDGSFQPDRHITRAEAVTIVNRMLNRVADRHFIDDHGDLDRFSDVSQNHWAFYDIMEAFDVHEYERHDDGEEEWLENYSNL